MAQSESVCLSKYTWSEVGQWSSRMSVPGSVHPELTPSVAIGSYSETSSGLSTRGSPPTFGRWFRLGQCGVGSGLVVGG
jgi:hypothetical protein